jgi:gamma-glutamylcyclotransferase
METFTYFAYGSNMMAERLWDRCPSAQSVGIATVEGYSLKFSKRSNDQSGKATPYIDKKAGTLMIGVLFQIRTSELADLDTAEGKGYGYDRLDDFAVDRMADGERILATTYLASPGAIDTTLQPYDWYQALVVQGALENYLPEPYIADLCQFVSIVDPNPDRRSRTIAIDALVRAGVHNYRQLLH